MTKIGALISGARIAPAAALSLSQQLPISTHIDVRLGDKWVRGTVSEDAGPAASTIKVRVGPENTFMIVPRKTIRLAARPTSISIGDHFEWYDGLGSGDHAGYYPMAYDSAPNSGGMYSKPENLYLPLAQSGATPKAELNAAVNTPAPGKYRCYAYGSPPNPPIFLGEIDRRADGSYTGHKAEGRYSFNPATQP